MIRNSVDLFGLIMLSTLSKRRRQGNNINTCTKHSRLTTATPSNFFATLFNHVPVPPPDRDPPVAAADPDPEEEITDMDEASRDTSSRPTAPPSTVLDNSIEVMWDTYPPLPLRPPAPTVTIQSIRHRLLLDNPEEPPSDPPSTPPSTPMCCVIYIKYYIDFNVLHIVLVVIDLQPAISCFNCTLIIE